jgi:hypothetical protein
MSGYTVSEEVGVVAGRISHGRYFRLPCGCVGVRERPVGVLPPQHIKVRWVRECGTHESIFKFSYLTTDSVVMPIDDFEALLEESFAPTP